jgi:predicted PurR-regulated permease PerM
LRFLHAQSGPSFPVASGVVADLPSPSEPAHLTVVERRSAVGAWSEDPAPDSSAAVLKLDSADIASNAEDALPEEEQEEMPLPSNPDVILLGVLLVLALLATAWLAAEIFQPMVFAFALNLLLRPGLRFLVRWRAPKAVAALILIVALFGTIVGVGAAVSGPAGVWAAKLPDGVPRLQQRLSFVREPIDTLQQFLTQVGSLGASSGREPTAGAIDGSHIVATLFAGARSFATGLFTTVLFLYFLLVSGDSFLRRLVEILPRFSSKRQAVAIAQQIESDISAYLVTITIMNAAVGIATAMIMWLTGVGDPILWGTVAFVLNYAPILGPLCGMVIFLLAGLLTIEPLWQALLPSGLYLAVHVIEGEAVTPLLLARRFTLNPFLVVLSLVFWFWMWGIPGAILAVPMLAIAKIACDRIRSLSALGHFLSD